ncbi:hypothetical protein A9Q99_05265 [Gammaproteobacteria bacterium 45_16_T64]|nr:hypothetical protein A9Q99_05265 [Gammaproteobacteria bacterium 45_16_T64]
MINNNVTQSPFGFSLLELLIVVSLLAVIAFTSMTNFANTEQNELDGVTRTGLTELADAVRQLHQDTGFWPTGDGTNAALIPTHTEAYNWEALTLANGLNAWDAVSQRGWRGPYIDKKLDARVVTNGNNMSINGSASGTTGNFNDPDCAEGIASPCPNSIVLLDPYGNPYVLLNIDDRNVIVSSGADGDFCTNLSRDALCDDADDLCPNGQTSDDITICP